MTFPYQRPGAPAPKLQNRTHVAEPIVATVRVCVKPGRAIAVCEFPPILELGDGEINVIDAVCRRLRTIVAEDAGSAFEVSVERGSSVDRRIEYFR